MHIRSILLYLLLLSSLMFTIYSPGAASQSMEHILKTALNRTELILAGEEAVRSKQHFKSQASAYMNPEFEAVTGRKKTETSRGTVYDVSVNQPFYFPGKQALRSAIAGQDIELAELGLKEARLFVYYETLRLAAAYVIAGLRAEHAGERIARFAVLQKYMASRPFASPRKRIEKYIVENKMDILSKELFRIRSEREILWARLNTFLGMKEKPEIGIVFPAVPPVLDRDSLIDSAAKHNTAFAALLAGVRKKKLERDLAAKEALPDFGVSAFYSGDSAGDGERVIGGGVNFTLPVFDRNTGTVRGLDAEIESENLKLAFERKALAERIKASYLEFTITAEAVAGLPDGHFDRMHRQMKEADDAFGKGLIDFVTYLELESDIYDKHQVIFESRIEYVEKLSGLLWLSGEMKNHFGGEVTP